METIVVLEAKTSSNLIEQVEQLQIDFPRNAVLLTMIAVDPIELRISESVTLNQLGEQWVNHVAGASFFFTKIRPASLQMLKSDLKSFITKLEKQNAFCNNPLKGLL